MSERNKPHNGRGPNGDFKVRQVDVDELLEDPKGVDYVRDDVRLGGAVEDVGLKAGEQGRHIAELIDENKKDVGLATGKIRPNEQR